MRKNQGSALITVLILMAFVMVIATSLISVTQSEFIMAKSSNDSNAAYYVAEAGIERTLSIMRVTYPISSILDDTEDPTKDIIDNLVSQYFYKNNSDSSKNYMYPYLNNAVSNDRSKISATNGITSYYDISFDISSPSTYDSSTNDYSKKIYITSVGHYGDSTRTIKSQYLIGGVLSSSNQGGGSNNTSYEDLDYFYRQNVLNIIDKNSNCTFGGMELNFNNGNVLFSTNKFTLGTNCNINTNNTENVAMIANTIIKSSGNLNFNNQYLFFDSNSAKLSIPSFNSDPQLFISNSVDSTKYSGSKKHNLTDILGDIGTKKNKLYNGSWPITSDPDYSILTPDFTHFKDFEFKPLPQNIDFTKPIFSDDIPPGQFKKIGIYYYKGPVNNINSIYLNDEYGNPGSNVNGDQNVNQDFDVLVSKGDLNINLGDPYYNSTFKFQGIIYCDGVINITNCNFEIDGIIIARGINCSGKFNANYESPNGHKLDYRIGLIDDIFRDNPVSSSSFNLNGISCTVWDMH